MPEKSATGEDTHTHTHTHTQNKRTHKQNMPTHIQTNRTSAHTHAGTNTCKHTHNFSVPEKTRPAQYLESHQKQQTNPPKKHKSGVRKGRTGPTRGSRVYFSLRTFLRLRDFRDWGSAILPPQARREQSQALSPAITQGVGQRPGRPLPKTEKHNPAPSCHLLLISTVPALEVGSDLLKNKEY